MIYFNRTVQALLLNFITQTGLSGVVLDQVRKKMFSASVILFGIENFRESLLTFSERLPVLNPSYFLFLTLLLAPFPSSA